MNWNQIIRQIGRATASRGRRPTSFPGQRRGYRRKSGWSLLAVIIIAAIYGYSSYSKNSTRRPPAPTRVERPSPRPPGEVAVEADDGGISELFRSRRSDVIVEAAGTVLKVLPDDIDISDGSSRHQRFTVQFPGGRTVLIAHNIDVAERVPLKAGDRIRFRGEYEWSEKGGTVHWTHHDPKRSREDGWIEHAGQTYK